MRPQISGATGLLLLEVVTVRVIRGDAGLWLSLFTDVGGAAVGIALWRVYRLWWHDTGEEVDPADLLSGVVLAP